MSIEGMILKDAKEIAARQHQRASDFHEQYLKVQAQADDLRAKRDAARAAPERLANFVVKLRGDYQCPACGIERNMQSALIPKPSTTPDDYFECVKCGHMLTIFRVR
jgi:transcription elongation factor Elf1